MKTRVINILYVISVTLFASACSEIQYEVGQLPDVSRLEKELTLKQSTIEDIRAALGSPSGQGRIMTPIDRSPRDVLSYYYEIGDVRAGNSGHVDVNMRRLFLFVYLDADRYDGYMWFSSLPQ